MSETRRKYVKRVLTPDEIVRFGLSRYRHVFAGGSVSASLGTPASDVDVFVIDEDREPQQVISEGRRVDIEFTSIDTLEELVEDSISEIGDLHVDGAELINRMNRSRMDTAVRFFYGQIISDDGTLRELQLRQDANVASLQSILITRHCIDVMNTLEDAFGASAVCDSFSARYLEREALLLACEALCASKSDLYVGTKWIWRKWKRSVQGHVDRALDDLVFETSDGSDIGFGRNLSAIQDILVMAISRQPYEIGRSERGFRRKDTLVPVPGSSSITLFDVGSRTRALSREGILLLGLANGRSKSETIAYFQECKLGAGIRTSEVERYFDTLVDEGLLNVVGNDEAIC